MVMKDAISISTMHYYYICYRHCHYHAHHFHHDLIIFIIIITSPSWLIIKYLGASRAKVLLVSRNPELTHAASSN